MLIAYAVYAKMQLFCRRRRQILRATLFQFHAACAAAAAIMRYGAIAAKISCWQHAAATR